MYIRLYIYMYIKRKNIYIQEVVKIYAERNNEFLNLFFVIF